MKPKVAGGGGWTSGESYENYVGRWSRLVAAEFITWLDVPRDSRWLDVGCGTGELTRRALDLGAASHVTGVDQSEAYIAYARDHSPHSFDYRVGDATALPVDDRVFDAAVSGLVINFVPEPGRAVEEMARATKSGGIVAAYVWDYAEGMQMMRYFWDAAAELDPAAAELHEGKRFSICTPAGLEGLFNSAGLKDIETHPIVVPTHFASFDTFWHPFLGAQGPAGRFAASLSDAGRERMCEILMDRLLVAGDGSIRLSARAWAVRGRVP